MRSNRLRILLILSAGLGAASTAWVGGAGLVASQSQPQAVASPVQNPAGQPGQSTTATGTAFLAGQVIDHLSGRGVPGSTVLLIGRGGRGLAIGRGGANLEPVTADSQGRFFFANLPAGSYMLQISKVGYSAAASVGLSRVVEVADAERITDLRVRLSKLASLAGTIRDDVGDPVPGSDVWALRRSVVNGRRTLVRSGSARSDDRGAYRIPGLEAGEYLVCACTRDSIPFDGVLLTTLAADPLQLMGLVARALKIGSDAVSIDSTVRTFAPTFHPASSTMARATNVTLAFGEEATAVDVDVTPTRATRVSGTIVGALGPMQASSIRLVAAGENDETAALAALTPGLVQPDGHFDFTGVPPGQYILRAVHTPTDGRGGGGPSGAALQLLGARAAAVGGSGSAQLSNEPPSWAAEPITVGENGVTGLSIALRRAASITGRVEFVGNSAPPPATAMGRLAIIPQPAAPDVTGLGFGNVGRLNADATFKMPGVLPGRYTLTATGIPGWPTMKSIVVAGVDVTDLPIEFEATDLDNVVITFTDAPATSVTGTVTGGSSSSTGDTTVLAFPTNRRYWTDPSISRRRFRTVPADHRGSFSMAGLPAGDYFVVAVPDETANDWPETARLESLSRTAQRVSIADGDRKTVEIKR